MWRILTPPRGVAHGAGGVVEEGLLLLGAHQSEQLAGLRVVVLVRAVIPGDALHQKGSGRFTQP